MCIKKRQYDTNNKYLLKESASVFDVIKVIVKNNSMVEESVNHIQTTLNNVCEFKNPKMRKMDIAIVDNIYKLRKIAEKESRKNKFIKTKKMLIAMEVDIVERGSLDYKNNKYNLDNFVIEDDVITSYIGKEKFVVIPPSVKAIGEKSFYNNAYVSEVYLGNNCHTIMPKAFERCESLKKVVSSCALATIADDAFYCCISLQDVVLEEGLVALGHYSFAKCPSLVAIKIPSTVTSIGDKAFFLDKKIAKKAKKKIKKINKKALG